MSITDFDKRRYDGLGAGIGHGTTRPLVDVIDELVTDVNGIVAADAVAAPSGVTVAEAPGMRSLVITLAAAIVPMVDEAGIVAYGGLKLVDLPEGAVLFGGATADLALTLTAAGINATWDGDFSLGTVTASNNGTLASTEQDLLPTTATPQAVSSATTAKGQSTATEAATVHDGTTTAKDVYLNILVDDADHDITSTPTNILVSGTITLLYAPLGDY